MTDGATELGSEELKQFEELARQYASRSVLPIFEGEFSDGDLSRLGELIDTAFEIGLMSAPDPESPGSELGVWGSATDEVGMLPSVMLLGAVAETCGGIAMAVHAQGVASNLLAHAKYAEKPEPLRVALSLQEGFTLPNLAVLLSPERDEPARIAAEAVPGSDGYTLRGTKRFVYSLPDPDAYVVAARTGSRWGFFMVPSDAEGLVKIDLGQRTGLRACELRDIRLDDVRVPTSARVGPDDALPLVIRALCLSWIGMTAIAAGIARGAVAAAKVYASERYQGGTTIENHPAVKSLIASSEARAATADSAVTRLSGRDLSKLDTLREAAMAKLSGLELCSQAVTDSLQTFGGYGYMEDYGMEKRLRDVAVLKSSTGSPLYLRQLIADIEKHRSA